MSEAAKNLNGSEAEAPPSGSSGSATATAPRPGAPVTTEDEKRLLEQIFHRLADLPAPVGPWLDRFVRRADLRLVQPLTDADAYRYIQFGHRFLRDLRRITEDAPELLAVADVPGLTYDAAIETLMELVQWTVAQRGARLVSTDDGSIVLLPDGISFALAVRQRLLLVIEGNYCEPHLARALRRHLLVTRRKRRSRPALLTELGTAEEKIRALVAEVHAALTADPEKAAEQSQQLKDPDALVEAERSLSPWAPTVQEAVLALEQLLPHIVEAMDRLDRAIDLRHVPKTPDHWGRPVQVLMVAMDYVFNALIRHAAAVADDGPLLRFVNLFRVPKSKGSSGESPGDSDPSPATDAKENSVSPDVRQEGVAVTHPVAPIS